MTKQKTVKFDYTSPYAQDLLKKVKVTGKVYDLKTITLSDWFTKSPTTAEIFERMEKEGLDYCPPDAFNQVVEGLKKGEWKYLGMERITDSGGNPHVFGVERGDDGGRWLHARWAGPDDQWGLGPRIVFKTNKKTLIDRVMDKVEKTDSCWNWKGATRDGYGRVSKGRRGEGLDTAHRVVYEAIVGKISKGMVIDHLCRNRACVNPEHLETVTTKENILRGESLPAKNARKTSCIRGHLLLGENLREYNGKRYCKTCQDNYERKSLGTSEPKKLSVSSDTLTPLGEALKVVKEAGYIIYKQV